MVALARLGAVQNPLIPILREREVGFITRQVGTEVMITTERWRGFDHGALAHDLAAEQGFAVILTDLDTDPASIGNTLRLDAGRSAARSRPARARRVAGALDLHVVGHDRRPEGRPPHRPDGDARRHRADPVPPVPRRDDVNPIAIPVSHIGGMPMLTASLMSGMRLVAVRHASTPRPRPSAWPRTGATVLGSAVPFFLAYFDAQRRHGDTPLFPRLRVAHGWRRAHTRRRSTAWRARSSACAASPARGASPSSRSRPTRHPTRRSMSSTTPPDPPVAGCRGARGQRRRARVRDRRGGRAAPARSAVLPRLRRRLARRRRVRRRRLVPHRRPRDHRRRRQRDA